MDSQVLNSIQLCQRRVKHQFVDNLVLPNVSEPIERGSLMHDMLEVYYGCIGKCVRYDAALWLATKEAGFDVVKPDWTRDNIAQFAVAVGRFRASKMALPGDEVDEVIFQFSEYHKFYGNDGWHPLAVEEVGSKLLFEDDDLQVIYNFKIDVVMEQGSKIWPWDHKTSSRRQTPSSMSNQFMGYAFGLNTLNIVVNKIGFQKTLKPGERFQRDILQYTKTRLEEWVENTIYWARMLDYSLQHKHYPMNLTSCDKFGGCHFEAICRKDVQLRELIMERDYKVGKTWDVAKVLEGIED